MEKPLKNNEIGKRGRERLPDHIVFDMRRLYRRWMKNPITAPKNKYVALANKYGCSRGTVFNALKGKGPYEGLHEGRKESSFKLNLSEIESFTLNLIVEQIQSNLKYDNNQKKYIEDSASFILTLSAQQKKALDRISKKF